MSSALSNITDLESAAPSALHPTPAMPSAQSTPSDSESSAPSALPLTPSMPPIPSNAPDSAPAAPPAPSPTLKMHAALCAIPDRAPQRPQRFRQRFLPPFMCSANCASFQIQSLRPVRACAPWPTVTHPPYHPALGSKTKTASSILQHVRGRDRKDRYREVHVFTFSKFFAFSFLVHESTPPPGGFWKVSGTGSAERAKEDAISWAAWQAGSDWLLR